MTLSARSRDAERLPPWVRRKIPLLGECSRIEGTVKKSNLHTICREGLCPNRAECYSRGKVTFMMLGDTCTRGCRFCSVAKGTPSAPDAGEPRRIAKACRELGLRHVIVTSVTRDDLPDGGASHFAALVGELRALDPAPVVEILVPDFRGDANSLGIAVGALPDIFSHNIETVRRLYPDVRKGADYDRSLSLLAQAGRMDGRVRLKSSLMLGLGETMDEVLEAMRDLREAGCDYIAIGQYMRPGKKQIPVARYVEPEEFEWLEAQGCGMGFLETTAGPLVRSSYQENRLE